MTEVKAALPRHFSRDEEDALRRDESTSNIVKKDTGAKVDIFASDHTWSEVKEHQQNADILYAKLAVEHAAIEGFEISEVTPLGVDAWVRVPGSGAGSGDAAGAVGGAAVIAGAVSGLAIGVYELGEAHLKGEEQAAALERGNMHVALISVLGLPPSYAKARLEGPYKNVAKGFQSRALKMAEQLMADPKGLATLRMHADRGMAAAEKLMHSHLPAEAFFKANPKIAHDFVKDAAFREGFNAFLYTKANGSAAEIKAMTEGLETRDGWYAASSIHVRG